jgi:two-component system chemotaxis sensor kinase CheA
MKDRKAEYLDIYFEEVDDLLTDLDQRLAALRSNPADADTLAALRRVAHTIKSSAGLMGFQAIKAFAKTLEASMDALKDGEIAPDAAVIDRLCESFEYFHVANAGLRESSREPEQDLAEKTRALDALRP